MAGNPEKNNASLPQDNKGQAVDKHGTKPCKTDETTNDILIPL